MPTKKDDKPQPQAQPSQPQAEPDKLAAMLATVFVIYRLREHRGETDE